MPEHTPLFEAIANATSPIAVFERLTQQCLELLPNADGAAIEMRRDADFFEYVTAAGTLTSFVGLKVPIATSLTGLAARTGAVQRTGNAAADPRVHLDGINATGVVSMLCVPLNVDGGVAAVLKVSSREQDAFDLEDAHTLMRLADFVAAAVDAASQLASVSARVMAEASFVDRVEGADTERSLRIARFVANVMHPGLVDAVDTTRAIERLLADDGVDIVLQPVFNLVTGAIRGFEALARFPGDEHSPEWWFHRAYDVGLGVDLELHTVVRALALLPRLPEPYRLAVNVGPAVVLDARFAALFDDIDIHRITLELTEHDAIADYAQLLTALGTLRDRGVRLSVDDAGNGYAGLSHIRKLLPDAIKLDRDLTTGIDTDPARAALATALVAFAAQTGAFVIAEGIERQEEADAVLALGIDHGQGYLLGRPAPLEDWFPDA